MDKSSTVAAAGTINTDDELEGLEQDEMTWKALLGFVSLCKGAVSFSLLDDLPLWFLDILTVTFGHCLLKMVQER